jgi:hypothetical protein
MIKFKMIDIYVQFSLGNPFKGTAFLTNGVIRYSNLQPASDKSLSTSSSEPPFNSDHFSRFFQYNLALLLISHLYNRLHLYLCGGILLGLWQKNTQANQAMAIPAVTTNSMFTIFDMVMFTCLQIPSILILPLNYEIKMTKTMFR